MENHRSEINRIIITIFLILPLLGCNLANRGLRYFMRKLETSASPTTTNLLLTSQYMFTPITPALSNSTQTDVPSATLILPSTRTPTATNTSTRTLKPPTATFTRTPSLTPIPPSITPASNQITAGQHAWTLLSVELLSQITVWEITFTPSQYPGVKGDFKFLRLNFDCSTGEPLTNLLSGSELLSAETILNDQALGTTFLHKPEGYENIYLTDYETDRYPVILYSSCWLAAAVPSPVKEQYTLYFRDLSALQFAP